MSREFVQSFPDWVSAVRRELDTLRAVDEYLTSKGRDYLAALSELSRASCFARNAIEARKIIQDLDAIRNRDAFIIVQKLCILAAEEEDAAALQLDLRFPSK